MHGAEMDVGVDQRRHHGLAGEDSPAWRPRGTFTPEPAWTIFVPSITSVAFSITRPSPTMSRTPSKAVISARRWTRELRKRAENYGRSGRNLHSPDASSPPCRGMNHHRGSAVRLATDTGRRHKAARADTRSSTRYGAEAGMA